MKEGWEICNLEKYIKLIDYRGRTPKKTESGVKLITAKNVKLGYLQEHPEEFIANENYEEWMRRGIPEYGDVIFTTEAPLANVAQLLTHEKVAFAQRTIVMQPSPDVLDKAFLKYLLLSPQTRDDIFSKATGATVTGIKSKLLRKIQIPIPPLSEQKQLVALLDRAFEKIEKSRQNIEKNIENAKELFQSKLNEIFSQKGDGWEEKSLGEMSKIMYGYTSKVVENGNVQYVRITDIQDGNVDWNTVPFVNISDEDKPKYQLDSGDIVFARTGATTGKSYLIEEPPCAVFASYLIRVQCNSKILAPEFLYLFFQSGLYWRVVESGMSGSAQGGFNASKLGKMKIHFPEDKKAQLKYVDFIKSIKSPLEDLENKYVVKLNNLDELKKSLLQKAFAGELTENVVEKEVQMAAEPEEEYK